MSKHNDAIFKKYPLALKAIGDVDLLEHELNKFDSKKGFAEMPGRIARVIDECVSGTNEFREALIICAYYHFDKKSLEGNIAYFDREYSPITERIAYDIIGTNPADKSPSAFLMIILGATSIAAMEMHTETFNKTKPLMTPEQVALTKQKMDMGTAMLLRHLDEQGVIDRYKKAVKAYHDSLDGTVKKPKPKIAMWKMKSNRNHGDMKPCK